MKQNTLALAVTAALAVLASDVALAQSTDNAQVVTVTAQKRKEDIRQVPLSVSVVSGEALKDAQIVNFSTLANSVPNLSYSTQAGAGLANLEIRGVSSQAGSATVAIYLDDVSLTTRNLYSQGTAEPRFFDLDRVEVLRGPQGTLYGASSLGGTIKFISNQPDLKTLGGGVLGELSSTSHGGVNHLLQGVLNIPLVNDQIGLRIGVQSGRDSGYIDQVDVNTLKVIDKGINSNQWNVVKLGLKAKINKDWSLNAALFQQDFKSADIDAAYRSVADYQSANVGAALAPFQTSKIVREPGTDKLTLPSLTLSGDLGFADLTVVASGYKRRFDRTQDGTSVNSVYIGSVVTDPALGAKVGFMPSQVNLNNRTDQTSLEVRLASRGYEPGGNPLTWIAGFFTARTKTQVYDDEPVLGINAAFKAAGKDINDPAQLADTFPNAFLGDSSYYSARHYNDKQSSVFGELTYNFSPTLRGILGLRVLRASEHFTREGDRYYAGGPSTAVVDGSASATTPRFAIDWDLDKTTTLYANVAKGFRLGAANRPVPLTELVKQDLKTLGLPGDLPTSFKPDSLWSYEAGSKSRLMGGKLTLNLAAFMVRWNNIQQDVVLPASGFDFETNVGKATSVGFEMDARMKVSEQLTVNASASSTRATFDADMPALGSTDGQLNVRKGDTIQGVPNYSARLGFEYRFQGPAGANAFVRGSGQWTGSSHGSVVRSSSDYLRTGYFTADASAGLNIDRWDVSLFVKNLNNNHTVIQQPSIQGVDTVYTLRPRTIGLTATCSF
jgi:outer membrane receptor protein involved in Fe transport